MTAKEMKHYVAYKVKREMLYRQMTQRELAKILKTARPNVCVFLKGKTNLTLNSLVKICSAVGLRCELDIYY